MKKVLSGCIAVLFIFFFTCLTTTRSAADGTYAGIGTGDGTDGSNDAINFSQGRVWTIDKYGKYIWLTQQRSGPTSHWAWSNDLGANWAQGSESYGFLTRASVAYDAKNDKLHVIWTATDSSDGIIYRRYGITRDGSNNITGIVREDSSNINLQLDFASGVSLDQAVATWVDDGSTNGILVASWAENTSGRSEVRVSMRKLTLTAADGVAGNWIAPDGSADTFLIDPPQVAADKVFTAATGTVESAMTVRGGAGVRKDDLYVFAGTSQSGTPGVYAYRAIWNSGSSNWSGGWQSPVNLGSLDESSGYNLKTQLITKPVLDATNDRLYIAWPRWKDNTAGDTVSFAYLNSTDTASSVVDVYSANGIHSYAPTVDIAFDNTLGQLYIAYVESTTNGDNGSIDYKTYDGTTLSGSTRFYTSPGGTAGADGGADIPILYEGRSSNDRLLFAFRINGALPPSSGDKHVIDWGYLPLLTATPTPTVTPTPTNTPTPTPGPTATSTPIPTPTTVATGTSGSSNSNSTSGQPATCSADKPQGKAPSIYAAFPVSGTSVSLYITEADGPVDHYVLSYGTQPGTYTFGADPIGGKGTRIITVSSLLPNSVYYFRVRAGNGCAAGAWSNEFAGRTGQSTFSLRPLTGFIPKASEITIKPDVVEHDTTPSIQQQPLVTETQANPTSIITQKKTSDTGSSFSQFISGIFHKVFFFLK